MLSKNFSNVGLSLEDIFDPTNPNAGYLKCGYGRNFKTEFAVGGKDADMGPWTVSLGFHESTEEQKYKHVCTGSILSQNVVITAAHCFKDSRITKVHAGRLDPTQYGLEHGVKKILTHDKYDGKAQYYDVALVILDKVCYSTKVTRNLKVYY